MGFLDLLLNCLLEGGSFKMYIYSNELVDEKPAGLKNCTDPEAKSAVMGGLVYKTEKGVCAGRIPSLCCIS